MCMAWCILYRSALGPSRSPCGAAGGGAGGGGAAGGFPGTGMIDGGFFGAQASAATRAAVTIARRIVRLFLGFRTSENGDHLGLFTRDLEQLPSPFAHVGSPADELFPLLGGGPEDTQVGDVLPVRRIRSWLRGHRGGSGETISRVLFTRWYEQMVISLGWLLPDARWALTPPFHPYPLDTRAVCSLWPYSVASRRPGVTWRSALWSSDFPRWTPAADPPRPSAPPLPEQETTGPPGPPARLTS